MLRPSTVFRFAAFAVASVFFALDASADATYHVFNGALNVDPNYSSVNAAFAKAIITAGNNTISIDDNNAGAGYAEPRMDFSITPLGDITITATGAVTITSSGVNTEIFRNRSTTDNKKLSIIGQSPAAPITLIDNGTVSIVSCETPNTLTRKGLLHLENVVLQKDATAASRFFLRIDSQATGQQYLKNVSFVGGPVANTFVLMQAGSADPNFVQNLYMESVSFAQANGKQGMMSIQNRATIEAKNCTFSPATGSNMPCVRATGSTNTAGGSQVVFRDCVFRSNNGGATSADAFQDLVDPSISAAAFVSPNVYKLYRPQLYDCGQVMFSLKDRPCEVDVLGLDDSDLPTVPKVDLNFVPNTGTQYALLYGNNKVSFKQCTATDDTLKSFGPGNNALVGTPQIELDHCEFKGTGLVAFNATGGAFGPVVTARNCVLRGQNTFPLPFISTLGSNTVAAQVTLTHCTFTSNASPFFTANAADHYVGPGTLFDGTNTPTIAAFALDSSSIPALAWSPGSANGSGFISVPVDTIVSDPHLANGRLTISSGPAFNAAVGSAETTDIDNDSRPLPVAAAANDIGADEAAFAPYDLAISNDTISEDVTNDFVVGTITITDPDNDSTISLTNDGGGAFKLVGNDLAVLDESLLDGVVRPSVLVEVLATDIGGLTYPEQFTLHVTHIAPTVISAKVQDGATVRVTFSRDMGGSTLDVSNYSVSGSGQGTFAANPDSVSAQSSTVYDLTWNAPAEMFNGGDIVITVANTALDAQGGAVGLPNDATDTGGGIGTPPVVQAITTPDSNPTDAASVNFAVTFSEAVNGFAQGDCTPMATAGALNGASVNGVTPGSGANYSVAVARGTGDVSFRLDVAASGAIADLAGNVMTEAFSGGDSYTIEELRFAQDLAASRALVAGDPAPFIVAFAGGVAPLTITWYYSVVPGGPFDPIDNAVNATYTIPQTAVENAGYYYVTATDPNGGLATSVTQHLTVDPGIPVAGLAGLAFLTAAAALSGIRATRRK